MTRDRDDSTRRLRESADAIPKRAPRTLRAALSPYVRQQGGAETRTEAEEKQLGTESLEKLLDWFTAQLITIGQATNLTN